MQIWPDFASQYCRKLKKPFPPYYGEQVKIAGELERKMAEVEKMRKAALRQMDSLQALPAAIIRGVFDFEEPRP
ncbi:hypothetical protein PITCH_A1780005 [uncultured Desulfobacterium sp.]|uniref:Uncharacterized protein n=1 Tax=uncultured Desulfobacterium sp. TaxID=201089 RepID=A0A445MUY1_9BACT|nr:hypothetical protein PITCH_A1780005 [uncultured Desulfobacterium sp.]